MSDLKVRRVRYDFAAQDVAFNWLPERPSLGMQCNLITIFAPSFEKFIVDATREAADLMSDPADIEEAGLFLRQEAQHSAAHASHFRAMVRRWPGLQETMDEVTASFRNLTATKPLHWRLAYTAAIESTFTPYFSVFLNHEDKMFRTGDERISSLFLWHFVEEIEHRSSALVVYKAVGGTFPYRVKATFGMLRHISEILEIIVAGMHKHVPAEDGGELALLMPTGLSLPSILRSVKATRALKRQGLAGLPTYAGVPRREVRKMVLGVLKSQGPTHDPADETLPQFADHWRERYSENPKVASRWYSAEVSA